MRQKEFLQPKDVRWLSGVGAVLSELLVYDGSDGHTFYILKIRGQFLSMEEYHESSPWALAFVRTALPVCSGVCPCHTCGLGISTDERHGYNRLKQKSQGMVDAMWETAETHLSNLQLLRPGPGSGPLYLLFLLPIKLFSQTSLISFSVLLSCHLLKRTTYSYNY